MRFLLALVALLPLHVVAQPGAYAAESYFEGAITYHFHVAGRMAREIKLQNPIEFMQWHIKDGDYLVHLYGRGTPTDHDPFGTNKPFETYRLFLADSNRLYTVDPKNDRVFFTDQYAPEDSVPPSAYPTGDSILVHNVMCYGYRVEKPDETITYYVSPKYKANLGYFPKNETAARASFLTEGLSGMIPLLTIRKREAYTITIKTQQINPMRLDKEQFLLPEGMQFYPRDYRRDF